MTCNHGLAVRFCQGAPKKHLSVQMEKFDNTKPNVVIISDFTEMLFLTKTLGPYKVASELRQAGYEVAVLHHAHIFSYEEIENILGQLISDSTLYVGFNNMFYKNCSSVTKNTGGEGGVVYEPIELGSMLPHGKCFNRQLKEFIKKKNPNTKLVIGGPKAVDISVNSDFDYVFTGYADTSAVNLADHLLTGKQLNKSHRSIYGPTVITDTKAEAFDFPNVKMEYKMYDCILPGETLPIEVGRGCIFKCAFCSYPLNGKKKLDHVKCKDVLLAELIDNFNKFGVTRYLMVDDTFNDSIEKAQMINDISKQLPFELEYWAYIRLDLLAAHPETADLLFDSGLRGCYFGIESWNKETGTIIGKGASKEKLIQTLKNIRAKWGNRVRLHGNFIAGLPKETIESLTDTYNTLMADPSLLDSWYIFEFYLQDRDQLTGSYLSDITKNPENFGYRNLYKIPGTDILYWENDNMNFYQAQELANQFFNEGKESGNLRIGGFESFYIAGLGFDLEFTQDIPIKDFEWNIVDAQKKKRSEEYKNMFYNYFGITV